MPGVWIQFPAQAQAGETRDQEVSELAGERGRGETSDNAQADVNKVIVSERGRETARGGGKRERLREHVDEGINGWSRLHVPFMGPESQSPDPRP